MEPLGDDLSDLHHFLHVCARSDAHQNPLVRAELLLDGMALQVIVELMVHDIRGNHQGQFTQLRQPVFAFPDLHLFIR